MADPEPPRKGADVFVQQISALRRKQSVARTPTGTQRFRSVEQLQNAIAVLQDQVEDLVGRVIVSATGTDPATDWTTTQPNDQPWGETLNVDLTEARRVFVDFSVYTEIAAQRTSKPAIVVTGVSLGLIVDGAPVVISGATYMVNAISTGLAGESTVDGTVWAGYARVAHALDLPAGSHTIRGSLATRSISIAFGSGSGYVRAAGSSIRVDVAQRLDI